MKLAAYGINEKATHGPDDTIRLAKLAEELGYDSWCSCTIRRRS